MTQAIGTNVMSLTAQRNLSSSQATIAKAMQRISSGLRINSAKDDAAGLAIAERMSAQVRGMNVAIRNAQDGISLAQTAEGGLQEVNNVLQRMRELAVQSANGTNSASDRTNLDTEYQSLDDEIERIAETTRFNDIPLLKDENAVSIIQFGPGFAPVVVGYSSGTSVDFQVGANTASANTLSVDVAFITSVGSDISSVDTALDSISDIDDKIDLVTSTRADFGAIQSRFESTISNLRVGMENQSATRGRIMDADYAVEAANLTRSQILQQAGNAMVSQANSAPQSVLQLLG